MNVKQSIQISVYKPFKNQKTCQLGKDDSEFFFQLAIETSLKVPEEYNENAKDDMLIQCRSYYKNNQAEMNRIKDFEENYQSNLAISWYTKDSFLYRIINKALRTKNLSLIYKFRFIIKDLHNQLTLAHNQQFIPNSKSITTYRGQLLKLAELNTLRENVQGILMINIFLSTTYDEDVARVFAGDASTSPFLESVLFEMNIPSTTTKIFANIKEFSNLKEENECLFTCCTIFRIDSCKKSESIWHVQLTLIEHDIENTTFNSYRSLVNIDRIIPTYWTLSSILFHLGDSEKRKHYYRMTFGRLPIKHPDFLAEYFMHGLHYKSYNLALEFCKKGFEQELNCSSKLDYDTLFRYYSEIGLICSQTNGYSLAINYYKKALAICLDDSHSSISYCDLGWLYVWIGNVYHKMGEYRNMMNYYNKGLEIQQQLYGNKHIELISLYNDMALGYIEQLDCESAKTNTIKSLRILFPSSSCSKGYYYFESTFRNILQIKKTFDILLRLKHKCIQQLCPMCREYTRIQNNDGSAKEADPIERMYFTESDKYGYKRVQLSDGQTTGIYVSKDVNIYASPDLNMHINGKKIENPGDFSRNQR
ncbi:unnamed protein product [Rotaria sordida]|uniref:NAD(P)(+)--arginine ADP-ribosyltransferase n=2 Tax=Rotaria sordida TaxID=392033 RepID=A0A815UYR1_9BILA|nr:unnamed protein product [Rotaria sordida]CAF1522423.1 unnamed protein product [Rotaria sordida]CAF4081403.1 unnamed protein product [Rotaria sordida]